MIPSFIRYKEVGVVKDTDSIFIQPIDSEIPNKVTVIDFLSADTLDGGILFGGTGVDEDVYKIIGGVGVSLNSDKITNE
jgi:hypothetical protein